MPNQNNTPNFEVLHMPPENTNSLLVTSGGDAVIFDAWGRADAWEKLLESRGLRLRAIYSTHGHGDHISAAPELAEKYNVPWYLNSEDNILISWSDGLLEYFGLPKLDGNYRAPTDIDSGNIEILPNIYMDVIETPGWMLLKRPDIRRAACPIISQILVFWLQAIHYSVTVVADMICRVAI